MPPGESLLIVNADDFGESDAITRGIADCIEAGGVTSTTILANLPGSGAALAWAAARGREASFGVHLNLCEGPSLTRAPSLTDASGRFHRKRKQALRAFAGRLDPGELERELGAQLARVRDAGVAISHLDGHKHLHQLPGVAEVVARLAAKHGVERVRCTREEGLWPRGIAPSQGLSRLLRRGLAGRLAPRLAAHGLRAPARTLDLAELQRLGGAQERAARLRRPGTTSELFCHPGRASGAGESGPVALRAQRRAAEREFLCSEAFRALLREAGVRLVSYWDL